MCLFDRVSDGEGELAIMHPALNLNVLQAVKPGPAWEDCTPVPMDQLYCSILEGRTSLQLPLDIGQTTERMITLGRLSIMPVKQHLQLQVMSSANSSTLGELV